MAQKIVLVTGANRGIGFAIVQSLAKQAPENTYILGAREITAGEEAVKQLKELGIGFNLEVLQLDVTKDEDIAQAVRTIKEKHGRLDILINNAGWAKRIETENEIREVYNRIFDTNITSVISLTYACLPLLKASWDARVINISSARGSISRQLNGQLPPTASIAYNVSKTALNVSMLELAKLESNVLYQAANPGHCKTAFNGFRGRKDPLDGAKVVVNLVLSERGMYKSGFWESEDEGMQEVPW